MRQKEKKYLIQELKQISDKARSSALVSVKHSDQ